MATLDFDGKRFWLTCLFTERALALGNKFQWHQTKKRFYTFSPAVAAKLREHATDAARIELNRKLIQITPWLSPLPPSPPGLELLPHQVEAVRFALERNRCYLALRPGLGKTPVAATIAAALSPAPVVYITPPFLVQNVLEEFKRWAPQLYADVLPTENILMVLPDVLIVRDSMLRKPGYIQLLKDVARQSPDAVLVVDEAHRAKNEDAQRTKAQANGEQFDLGFTKHVVTSLWESFSRVIFMSGTPMPNRPIELFPILSKMAGETIDFMNRYKFAEEFCAGHKGKFGWKEDGASNLPELRRRVIHPTGPFMLRMEKSLLNLPPKLEELFVLSATMTPQLASLEADIGKRYKDVEDLIKARLAQSFGTTEEKLPVATYRRLLGNEKVAPSVEYIKSLLDETDEKLLVFAYHQTVITAIAEQLAEFKPLIISGQTTMAERHKRVKEFQTNKERRIIIGNYLAMGVGFNLTAADRVIMVEFDWVPGSNIQATDRPHRIGRTEPVYVQYIVMKDSLDKLILETLMRKTRATNFI